MIGSPTSLVRLAGRTLPPKRIVAIAAACLIEGILVLGFVALSLGLGAEGHVGVGPDRPPPPVILKRSVDELGSVGLAGACRAPTASDRNPIS